MQRKPTLAQTKTFGARPKESLLFGTTLPSSTTTSRKVTGMASDRTPPAHLARQKQSVRVTYDRSVFSNPELVKRTLLTKSSTDRNDMTASKLEDHSLQYRHMTSSRAISSEATFFAASNFEPIIPYEAVVTTVCGINLSGTNPQLEDEFISLIDKNKIFAFDAFYKKMKQIYLLALHEQAEMNVNVSILSYADCLINLTQIPPESKVQAKRQMMRALRDAVTALGKNNKFLNVKEIIVSAPGDSYEMAKNVFSKHTSTPRITVTTADMFTISEDISYQNEINIGVINDGSDRGIGGEYTKTENLTQEELCWNISNIRLIQAFENNDRLNQADVYHDYTEDALTLEHQRKMPARQLGTMGKQQPIPDNAAEAKQTAQNKLITESLTSLISSATKSDAKKLKTIQFDGSLDSIDRFISAHEKVSEKCSRDMFYCLTLLPPDAHLSVAIHRLINHSEAIKKRGYNIDARALAKLANKLTLKTNDLKANKIQYDSYKSECNDLIDQAQYVIDKHHDCKRLLSNIVLAIAGLGLIYLIAGMIHQKRTGHFLFFNESKTRKMASLVQKEITLYPLRQLNP